MKRLKSQRAITLVALVVTIVVLLILAGITIALIMNNNGIINRAIEAIDETKNKSDKEIEYIEGLGNYINEQVGEGGNGSGGDEEEQIPEGAYSIAEVEPSPMDLFYYEPISTTTGKLASTELSGLPEKKARITGLKEQYCNYGGVGEYPDTHYEIIYNGTKISDTLVIPYKVRITEEEGGDSEWYTVTEVDLNAASNKICYGFPDVKIIIYPNTVDTITFNNPLDDDNCSYNSIKSIILPNNLKNIGKSAMGSASSESEIWVPNSVTSMSEEAFWKSSHPYYGTIKFEGTEEQWKAYGLSDKLNVEYNCTVPTTIPKSTE